jgi:hypothetical protein
MQSNRKMQLSRSSSSLQLGSTLRRDQASSLVVYSGWYSREFVRPESAKPSVRSEIHKKSTRQYVSQIPCSKRICGYLKTRQFAGRLHYRCNARWPNGFLRSDQ